MYKHFVDELSSIQIDCVKLRMMMYKCKTNRNDIFKTKIWSCQMMTLNESKPEKK